MDAEIDFRIPQPFRTFSVGWFSVLALGAVFSAIEATMHGALAVLLISVIAAGLFTAVAWRWSRVGVRSTSDALIVRNFFSKRTIPRESVAGFRLDGARFKHQARAIRVLRTDGSSVVIAATERYSGSPVHPRSTLIKARHDEQLAGLRIWLAGARGLDGSDTRIDPRPPSLKPAPPTPTPPVE
ncbi:MAG: PH domain-containing protein [Candidatus Dormibacteria bacterium]